MDSEKVSNYEAVLKAGNVGVCLQIKGVVVKSPAQGQYVELHATEVVVLGACDAKSFPLAKKRHTLEHLRDIAHLRSRTNTVAPSIVHYVDRSGCSSAQLLCVRYPSLLPAAWLQVHPHSDHHWSGLRGSR